MDGALVEPKKASVAVHYRLVAEAERPAGARRWSRPCSPSTPTSSRSRPGKMVYEIQPKLDWDKGKAVLHLLAALELDRDDVVPLYLGDDITDEDAFGALERPRASASSSGDADDPEVAGPPDRRRLRPRLARRGGASSWTRSHADRRLVRQETLVTDDFTLAYDGFDPDEEGLREALTSTGNGYFCTRGTAEWEDADDVHYPGTYAHGVLQPRDDDPGRAARSSTRTSSTCPNWLVLKLRIEGEDAIRLDNVELLDYRHELRHPQRDGHPRAALPRPRRPRDDAAQPALRRAWPTPTRPAIEWTLTPENWSGRLEVVSALDGRVTNRGVARYRAARGPPPRPRLAAHVRARGHRAEGRRRASRTSTSPRPPARASSASERAASTSSAALYQMEDYIQQVARASTCSEGEPVRVEKMVAFYTSRDRAINEPLTNAGKSVGALPGLRRGARAPRRRLGRAVGRRATSSSPATTRVQLLLRLHISHILQVCSRHTADHDAGVPARGLNGEAYRGHVFWDELYVYPFLNFRLPEITRELLMYRYRRLGEARAAAREAGYRGAMFPWQSGSDGSEETQVVHLNPLSGQLGSRPQPQPAPRQRGDLLQRLALLPGHRATSTSCATTAPR